MKNHLSLTGMTMVDILVVAVCGAILFGYIRLLLLIIDMLKDS